jgi:pimeloyl-ACP methyl ester carboxylesterase
VLEATDATDALLVGHSLGGMTIQSLALADPDVIRERVNGIVLVATSAHKVASGRFSKPSQMVVGSRVAQRVMSSNPGNRFARRAFGASASPDDVAATRAMFASCDAASRRGLLAAMHTMDLRGLRSIDVPVTVVAGAKDHLTPVKRGRELAQRLGARLDVLSDVGHMIPLEAPDELAGLISNARLHRLDA